MQAIEQTDALAPPSRPTLVGGSSPKVAYVVKRYPRFSETFIVNELLAHQEAGAEMEIFALRPPNDTHFQDSIARVRAPVTYLPHAGIRARDLWSEIRRYEGRVDVLAGGLVEGVRADVVDVHQALVLARHIEERGIGHLHAHFGTSATSVARLASAFAGIGFSFTAHAKDIFHEEVDPADLVSKMAAAETVVTVSDYNAAHLQALAEEHGARAPTIRRIYNGLDLDSFEFRPPADRRRLVVGVGRLVEKKGFEDLIDACALLARRGVDFGCRIIGTGALEQALERRIVERGLTGCVELTGPMPQNVMREEVRSAAVLAAPCVIGEDGNRDGLPTTLLEAMALGTSCVSTDVTGIPEAVRDGETGLIVAQHDPKQLAAALESLLEEESLRGRLATNARRLIESEFDVRKSTERLREVFDTALGVRHDGALSG